jgi:hypothetical protein
MRMAEDGRRVSSRVHRKPLEWYRNEHVEYTRQHQSEWVVWQRQWNVAAAAGRCCKHGTLTWLCA